jgi:hypothetical protein
MTVVAAPRLRCLILPANCRLRGPRRGLTKKRPSTDLKNQLIYPAALVASRLAHTLVRSGRHMGSPDICGHKRGRLAFATSPRFNARVLESWAAKSKMLTREEFASLLIVGNTSAVVDPPAIIPVEHSDKLISLGYMVDLDGRLRMTTPGRQRMAAGEAANSRPSLRGSASANSP